MTNEQIAKLLEARLMQLVRPDTQPDPYNYNDTSHDDEWWEPPVKYKTAPPLLDVVQQAEQLDGEQLDSDDDELSL